MKNLLVVLSLSFLAARASAQPYIPNAEQEVIVSSVTMGNIVVGTLFTSVTTTTLAGSWMIEVQNLSSEQVCCAFDSAASAATHAGKACVRIDTAPTAAASGFVNWKLWKRFAQNLSLYCKTLKSSNGSTAELVITQGK